MNLEKEIEVKTMLVTFDCDDCGGNVIKNTGEQTMILTNPPKFKHHCEKCDKEYLFNHHYPYTRYIYSIDNVN